jgi:hypothetical protein
MTNKMKLLIGLLALGIVFVGGGTLVLLHPLTHSVKTPVTTQTIYIPDGTPVLTEELTYLMRGQKDSLSIFADGSLLYTEEKGLRFPTPGNPATRTWKTGKLPTEELTRLMDYVTTSGFDELNDSYFTGTPSGDGSFKFTINSNTIQKTVTDSNYLTPDHDETYPDMPSPFNELYSRLRVITLSTTEIGREIITP